MAKDTAAKLSDQGAIDSRTGKASGSLPITKTPGQGRHRKKTSLACQPCQHSHYSCDEGRPCRSCMRRGRAEQCVEGIKKRARYLESARDRAAMDQLRHPANTATTFVQGLVPTDVGGVGITPFGYAESHARLLQYLQARLLPDGMKKVHEAFAGFRPTLVAHLLHLSFEDLVLMEHCYLRSVKELQRLLPLTGAPYCAWRRSGELAFLSYEFALLTGWPVGLPDGCRTIFELWDDAAVVAYWEGFAPCVLEKGAAKVQIKGGVHQANGTTMAGAWWITIKKDLFDIPSVIIGCFLPDLWPLLPQLQALP